MDIAIRVVLLGLSLLMVGFFASMEAAFSAVDRLALSHLATKQNRGAAAALDLTQNREQLLTTILLGTNISVVLFTVTSTSLSLEFNPFGIYTVPITALMVVLLINVFGELIPKTRAARSPLRFALRGTRILAIIYRLIYPFAYVLVAVPRRFLTASHGHSDEEQIRHIVEYAEEQRTLPVTERDMIFGLLDSGHTPVREVMVPRINMAVADLHDGMEAVLEIVRDSGFSRIPVFDDSIDNIIGVLYAKDLLTHLYTSSTLETLDLKTMLRPALYVPGSKRASDLLRELKESRTHMAIVIDEYGGVEGLVTIEDLLEEIVGEIRDEYDHDEEVIDILPQKDGTLLVHGRVSLEDLREHLAYPFEVTDATTVAGLLLERLERIPGKGDQLIEGPFRLTVEKMSHHQITLIRIAVIEAGN